MSKIGDINSLRDSLAAKIQQSAEFRSTVVDKAMDSSQAKLAAEYNPGIQKAAGLAKGMIKDNPSFTLGQEFNPLPGITPGVGKGNEGRTA